MDSEHGGERMKERQSEEMRGRERENERRRGSYSEY